MEKTEIIFSIVLIVAYLICSIALKIPLYVHLMFGAIILGVLLIAILLKFNHEYENEKISKIFKIITILLIIYYFAAATYESFYNGILLMNSALILILIAISAVIKWIFSTKD